MSQSFDEISAQLKRRHRRSARLKWISMGALGLAGLFLVVFFADMLNKGLPAFQQTRIQVEVDYSEQASQLPLAAVDEEVRDLVSRGWLRTLPRLMRNDPARLGTSRSEWVLADGQVDQYFKGHASRLRDDARERVDALAEQGRVALRFNTTFFTRGDSKMPELAGIMSAAIGTVMTMLVTLAVAFPIGVMTAVYLEEFAPDNRLTQIIEININNLAAVPSIVFGLLGLAVLLGFFGLPRGAPLVGGMVLSLMTLPTIIIATRAALKAVPPSIREAAYGVGASKQQVVMHHVLPLAMPGIMTGAIIGTARAMGESAAVLMIGMVAFIVDIPKGITDPATVLPVQIFLWADAPERGFVERTSAGIMVMDEDTCMVKMLYYATKFFSHESCGQCFPCREGTQRMREILTRITQGKGTEDDLRLLDELCWVVKETSLCGLGQTAPNPVLTTLRYFRDEYLTHIREKRCPAKVCRELIVYHIESTLCDGCHACVQVCSTEAILGEKKSAHTIDGAKCIKCGACLEVCQPRAVLVS